MTPADNDGTLELFDFEDRTNGDDGDQEIELTTPAEVTQEEDYTMPNLHMGSNDPRVTREEVDVIARSTEKVEIRETEAYRIEVSQELVEIAQVNSGLTGIPVNLSAFLDSETLDDSDVERQVVLRGVPENVETSVGTRQEDGTVVVDEEDVENLVLIIEPGVPVPAFDVIAVIVDAPEIRPEDARLDKPDIVKTEDVKKDETEEEQIAVAGDTTASSPNLDIENSSGAEDQAISLNVSANLTDTDGSETLEILASGIPAGATLSAGTNNGDGSWTLLEEDLAGLTITPPSDFSGTIDVDFTATSTEQAGGTATVFGTASVTVLGVADTPVLSVANASGAEDTAIGLDFSADLTDNDGSETLSITVSGVPSGANLSAGSDNGDGSWTLSRDDLDGLRITPPTDYFGNFTLSVTATSQDGSDTSTISGTATVNVTDVIDITRTGTSNADRMYGGDEGESFDGGAGNDRLYTGGGNDHADGGAGRDDIRGGDGEDTLLGGGDRDSLRGDSGNDTLSGGDDSDALYGGTGDDRLSGDAGNDTLRGDAGADELRGGAGNDRLYVDSDDTVIEGGDGLDRIDVQGTGGVSIGAGASIETAVGNVGDDSFDGSDLETRATFYGRDGDDQLAGGSAADRLYGDAGSDTLSGNDGNDYMMGGSGADELRGGAGNDRLYVDSDDTVIEGGDGLDRIDVQGTGGVSIGAGASIETAVGNVGDDSFDGSDLETRATFYGRDGDDQLAGGSAADRLYGDAGSDTLSGNDGNDYMMGGAGADELRGGAGNDRLYVDSDDTVIEGGDGLDRIDVQGTGGVSIGAGASIETAVGNVGDDSFDGSDLGTRATFYGRDGDDQLAGGSAADRLYGDAGSDTLSGNDGNDYIVGGAGADELRGGAGNDRLYVDSDDTVIEGGDGLDRIDVQGTGGVSIGAGASIETAVGNAGDDSFDGSDLETRATFYGRDGDDQLTGGSAGDRLYGDAGSDTLSGNAGNDDLRGGADNDIISGGEGNDTLRGDAGADEFRGGAGNDRLIVDSDDTVIEGGDGIDRMDVQGTGGVSIGAAASIETAYGNVGNDSFDGSDLETRASYYGRDGDDQLTGGSAGDRLYGDGGSDTLVGNAGNDDLRGGTGNDVISGGEGNDTLRGDAGADELRGGAGNDRLYVDGDDTVIEGGDGIDRIDVVGTDGVSIGPGASIETAVGNVGDDSFDGSDLEIRASFYGRDGNDQLTGGSAADRLYGDGGDDTLSGNAGNDDLRGGSGNDTISGGDDNDYLRGDAGNDTLNGDAGNDRLYGGDGNDALNGGLGADRLYGQDGNDTLDGGAGNDILDGGAGDDLFIFGEGNGTDTVHGGAGWLDSVQLQGSNGAALAVGDFNVELSSGSIDEQADGYIALSQDAAGTVTLNDGSELHFDGLERIEW
jgi:Ca2+-binding RTX toxin-like protein